MKRETTRFGFPPLPDHPVFPASPPLSAGLAELAGFWIEPRCGCRGTTFWPLRLMAARYGWQLPLSALLDRLRCHQCGQRPHEVMLTDRADRGVTTHGTLARTMRVR